METDPAPCDLPDMLFELCVENLALFERAALLFGGGLNAITGETGAGKSLLLDALEFLLGSRPRAGLVRAGAAEARVSGRFVVERARAGRRLAEWLAENVPGALADSAGEEAIELLLSRALTPEGRSRSHVNERAVSARALRELAALLVEIHGQNDHQRLFDPGEQRQLLDDFGAHGEAVAEYRAQRATWSELAGKLARFDELGAARATRLETLREQIDELSRARLRRGEGEELRGERERLRHAEELRGTLGRAVAAVYDDEDGALDRVRRAQHALAAWEGRISELGGPAGEFREAIVWLEQAEAGLRAFVDGTEASPERLEEVESRLAEIERLERKHRCTADELVDRAAALAQELAALEDEDVDREGLEHECAAARRALVAAAGRVTSARKRAASKLERAVKKSLADLGLAQAVLQVQVAPRTATLETPDATASPDWEARADGRLFGHDGIDAVELLLASNPGEPPQPLRHVASGGEAARVMLALRSALALRQSIPTLVFDEVDAGVGGRLAPRVGAHLASLGETHQILCVTHLPAVAAVADVHLRVKKEISGKRTKTSIVTLSGEERVAEVADMIAGGAGESTARAEAKRLLDAGPRARRDRHRTGGSAS